MSFGLHACTDPRSTVCRRMAAAHQGTMLVSACTAASSVIYGSRLICTMHRASRMTNCALQRVQIGFQIIDQLGTVVGIPADKPMHWDAQSLAYYHGSDTRPPALCR